MCISFCFFLSYSGEKDAGDKKEKDKKKGTYCIIKFLDLIDSSEIFNNHNLVNIWKYLILNLYKLYIYMFFFFLRTHLLRYDTPVINIANQIIFFIASDNFNRLINNIFVHFQKMPSSHIVTLR